MLLKFTCKNYKTFKTGIVLSLLPNDSSEMSYSLITSNTVDKAYKGLCSAVIYGPNAAGKSNLISAMETLRYFVLQGLNNLDYKTASRSPLLFSNFKSKEDKPVELSISFITENMLFKYSIAFRAIKTDAEESYDSCTVVSERLDINSELVFNRVVGKRQLSINSNNRILLQFAPDITKGIVRDKEILNANLSPTDLFLTNGFKNFICLKLVEIILTWFEKQFLPIYNSQKQQLFLSGEYEDGKFISLPASILNAVQMIGGDNKIGYKKDLHADFPTKTSIITKGNKSYTIASNLVESLGTLRFLDIFPLVISAFQQGSTLIIDELDASVHPQVIASLIGAFHNPQINTRGAQLIFNTQNPVFLNKALFRKDEIYFVEKNRRTLNSELYSLADLPEGPYTKNDFMMNYLKERYGAMPEIDISRVLLRSFREGAQK